MAHAAGVEINGYTIEAELNRGAFANAYRAAKGGRFVFLKEYISPKPSIAWYSGFVAYQNEIKRRIETSVFASLACGMLEFFKATRGVGRSRC